MGSCSCNGGGTHSFTRWYVFTSRSFAVDVHIHRSLFFCRHVDSYNFVPGACERFEPFLRSRLVGQELALKQTSDAICDHLAKENPIKPLVMSFHGPPGVGKSLFHRLAARVLYIKNPEKMARQCPGRDCAGYKVLYGMDYLEEEKTNQHMALRTSVLSHLKKAPESLIVIEEYDKLDCHMRGFFRQLLENSMSANVSLAKAVVLLESNLGWTQLHELLESYKGDQSSISAEHAQRTLKDLVFQRWLEEGCEDRTDTLKMVGLVDFFLPFFPLQKKDLEQIVEIRLGEKLEETVRGQRAGPFIWGPEIAKFILEKVDFDGRYAVEGAKEVDTLVTRYVSRPLREWVQLHRDHETTASNPTKKKKKKSTKKQQFQGRLRVSGQEFIVEPI